MAQRFLNLSTSSFIELLGYQAGWQSLPSHFPKKHQINVQPQLSHCINDHVEASMYVPVMKVLTSLCMVVLVKKLQGVAREKCTTGVKPSIIMLREGTSISMLTVFTLYQCSKVKEFIHDLIHVGYCGTSRGQMARLWRDSSWQRLQALIQQGGSQT